MQKRATSVTVITEMVPVAYMVLNTIGTVVRIEYGPQEAVIHALLRSDDAPERAVVVVTQRTDGVDFALQAAS